ncbi:MAG: sigma-70 family RNA polymerase sigma factor [Kaiparowitsia implicata GSE-PSE-MK54-09C]|jgi:DNA-directed RNA polymerase specialized sigma24 family protein|nr:sigma-70 family RNA polymerase sigma factor [Kaiparowitsia implicata GSE-PSE-MK54-09C]
MPHNSKPLFDANSLDSHSFRTFVQETLEHYRLSSTYSMEDVISAVYEQSLTGIEADQIHTIQFAWLKTVSLDVIKQLSRRKFDVAVQALFDGQNPDARSFFASITNRLRQFRLLDTYEVREIIAEAYARGVKYIDAGHGIDIPVAWLRRTCFNVIFEFRRKQDKLEHPRINDEPVDDAFSELIFDEDIRAIRIALTQLSDEERTILCNRVLKRQAWQEIGQAMSTQDGTALSANAARQRGYRVLQKLRHLYDEVRDSIQTEQADSA